MPPDHTYEAFSTDALETELFLEGIFRDDWQNPATTIWIVAFLESYLSSGSLDAATTVSEIAYNFAPQTSELLTLYSISLILRDRIPEASQRLHMALCLGDKYEIASLLRMYCSRLAEPSRTDGPFRLSLGHFPCTESLLGIVLDLRKTWQNLPTPDSEPGSRSGASSISTRIPIDRLSNSGPETTERGDTLEDLDRTLASLTSEETLNAEVEDEYRAASEARQANIWYLETLADRMMGVTQAHPTRG